MKKNIITNSIITLLLPFVGLVLLILVHLIPTDNMLKNVYSNQETIINEFTDEVTIDGYKATLTGNFTDCIMLENAIYDYSPKHNVLSQVLTMYRPESYYVPEDPDGMQPGNSIIDYMNGIPQPQEFPYARYWHGYLVFLKPLLLFFSFNSIRLLNSILLPLLLSLCIILIQKESDNWQLALVFSFSALFMYFSTSFQSLNLSICMYLTLIGSISIFVKDYHQKDKTIPWKAVSLFILLGAITSYLDFLTYPLAVFCFPLCLFFYKEGQSKLKELLIKLISLCLAFGFGYIFMWASKWILASIFTDSNIIKDAWETIKIRTGEANDSGHVLGYTEVLKKNLSPFLNRPYAFLILLILLFFLFCFKKYNFKAKGITIIYILIGLFPFVWWFITANHSVQHWIFTCRIFSITIFSFSCGILSSLHNKEQKLES